MSLLSLRGVTRDFQVKAGLFGRSRVLRAVDGIDLEIHRGETLALVGESGCGKSTLGRIVAGLLPASAGDIRVNGQPARRGRARARQIQIVFQDPFGSLNPKMSVGELIIEPALLHGLVARRAAGARVAELLGLVGLRVSMAARYPHELSGGQRQRVALARALAAEPELIVCDEAVSALDVSVQAQIANLLKEVQARTGISLLFISHGLSLVHQIADRVAVMYLGRIVEQGPVDSVFTAPRHPYARALIAASPPRPPEDRVALSGEVPSPLALPSGCRFRTRCPHASEPCATAEPRLTSAPHAVACWHTEALPPYRLRQTATPERLMRALNLYRHAARRQFETREETAL